MLIALIAVGSGLIRNGYHWQERNRHARTETTLRRLIANTEQIVAQARAAKFRGQESWSEGLDRTFSNYDDWLHQLRERVAAETALKDYHQRRILGPF